jgi:hypothetical protein
MYVLGADVFVVDEVEEQDFFDRKEWTGPY